MLGGDPVGSTDPEVSRIYIPAPIRHVKCLCMQFWRLNAEVMHVLGIQRPCEACSGRSTPMCSMFLALNASSMLVTGVQRQLSSRHITGVQMPECCLFLAFSARYMLCSGVERQPDAPYWR